MALRGRKIDSFDDISLTAWSQGLPIYVSSTSFQRCSIGWPQQPPKEKVLKFNLIFHDSIPKKTFFQKSNKADFNKLDDSKVPSSDFPGLRTSAASMTLTASTASTTSMVSMTSTASFHQKIYWL